MLLGNTQHLRLRRLGHAALGVVLLLTLCAVAALMERPDVRAFLCLLLGIGVGAQALPWGYLTALLNRDRGDHP